MGRGIALLLAEQLPSVLLIYWVGTLIIRRLQIKSLSLFVGFLAAWLLAAFISLLLAEGTNLAAASNQSALAGLLGSISALLLVAIAGRRKSA